MALRRNRPSLQQAMEARKARQQAAQEEGPHYDDTLSSHEALRHLIADHSEEEDDAVEDIPMADILADNAATDASSGPASGVTGKSKFKPKTRPLKKKKTRSSEQATLPPKAPLPPLGRKDSTRITKPAATPPPAKPDPVAESKAEVGGSSLDALLAKAEEDRKEKEKAASLPAVTDSQLDMLFPEDEPATETAGSTEAETVIRIDDLPDEEDEAAIGEGDETRIAGLDEPGFGGDMDFKAGLRDLEAAAPAENSEEIVELDADESVEDADLVDSMDDEEDSFDARATGEEDEIDLDVDPDAEAVAVDEPADSALVDDVEDEDLIEAEASDESGASGVDIEEFESAGPEPHNEEAVSPGRGAEDEAFVEVERTGGASPADDDHVDDMEYPFEMEGITEEIPALNAGAEAFDDAGEAPTLKPSDYESMGSAMESDVALDPNLQDKSDPGPEVGARTKRGALMNEKARDGQPSSKLRKKTRAIAADADPDRPKSRRMSRTGMSPDDEGGAQPPRMKRKPKEMDIRVFYACIGAMVLMLLVTAVVGYIKFFYNPPAPKPIVENDLPEAPQVDFGPWLKAKSKYDKAKEIGRKARAAYELEDWKNALEQYQKAKDMLQEAKNEGNAAIEVLKRDLGDAGVQKKRDELHEWQETLVTWRNPMQRADAALRGAESDPAKKQEKKIEELLDAVYPVMYEAVDSYTAGNRLRIGERKFPEAVAEYTNSQTKFSEAIRMAEEILAQHPDLQYKELDEWRAKLAQLPRLIELAKAGSSED